jgi:hypothetical protein
MEIVEYRLSQSHPKPDICDLYTRMDRYGLGPGLYPREHCPKPPLHPFCRCLLRPRLDLHGVKVGRPRKAAAASVLRATGQSEGARIAGSRAKRAAILGGENLEEVLNEGRAEAYRIQTLGGTILSVEKVSAYEVAKAGGQYAKFYNRYRDEYLSRLQRASRGYAKVIEEHEQWIKNPRLKLEATMSDEEVARYAGKKWPRDVVRNTAYKNIIDGIIRDRQQ